MAAVSFPTNMTYEDIHKCISGLAVRGEAWTSAATSVHNLNNFTNPYYSCTDNQIGYRLLADIGILVLYRNREILRKCVVSDFSEGRHGTLREKMHRQH